ncbi:hypothetical protein FB451DRAFT_1349737 [Mycena latifolia]|nr:hypothetical protein FB451DRAFT_1349737 [Mycena latifolia]
MDPKTIQAMHPEMYVPDANIDRHTCRRVVPMEVLSLGMSRTGTAFAGPLHGVTDAPCNAFAPELIDAYPEAKVVLVERDLEAWYTSFQNILEPIYRPDFRVAAFLDLFWMGKLYRMTKMWIEGQFGATTLEKGQQNARKVYQEHYAEVRRVTPKERLLEFKLESGWEPLCQFLGKDIPNVPFPRVNEAAALKSKMEVLGKKSMGRLGWRVRL